MFANKAHYAFLLFLVFLISLASATSITAEPGTQKALETMKKAADFMANTVSTRGGYLSNYSTDLSRRWGEIPARESQISCQPPGTTTVGMAYIEAYKATGDGAFLRYAEMAADALIWGQHPSGGWHYIIDFDMTGIEQWYKEGASVAWGWEEYYHYYGNCSFDDEATSAPAEFLLELYMTTLDPAYRAPLMKALGFIIESQYPNGAWPQRYPLKYDYPHDGHDDYTHYYTFNDGVAINNIMLLVSAWEKLGDEAYLTAARRGMDFYIISQLAEPQAGWAQQYTMDMQPGAARTYEPAAVTLHGTLANIRDLQNFYKMTGDRRYLEPIPRAIDWIERSAINDDASQGYTHAGFYEPVTNKPLYYHYEGDSRDNYRFWLNQTREGSWWYRRSATPNVGRLKKEYARVSSLTPDEAQAEYEASTQPRPPKAPDTETVESLIKSLDPRGAWITDMRVRQYDKGMIDPAPTTTVSGIDISVFARNLRALAEYVRAQ